jgi:hypothetical protein
MTSLLQSSPAGMHNTVLSTIAAAAMMKKMGVRGYTA